MKWGLTDNEMRDCGRHPDNVTHHQVLPTDQIWRRSTMSTHYSRGCCRLAGVVWHLEHMTTTH